MLIVNYEIIDELERKNGNTIYMASKAGRWFVLRQYTDHAKARNDFTMSNFLKCQYILPYDEIFEARGKTFLAQLFVHGQTMHDLMNKNRSINDKLSLAEKILKGLKCIHEKGVIYNNLSFDNIFKGYDGQFYFFHFSRALDEKKQNRVSIITKIHGQPFMINHGD